MEDEILTIEEAAKMLKVSQGHIRKLVRQGELPLIRRGRRYTRFRKRDIEAFLNRYTTKKEVQR